MLVGASPVRLIDEADKQAQTKNDFCKEAVFCLLIIHISASKVLNSYTARFILYHPIRHYAPKLKIPITDFSDDYLNSDPPIFTDYRRKPIVLGHGCFV